MSTYAIGSKKHLTLADRAAIEHGICQELDFTQTSEQIHKDSSAICKEIRHHLIRVPHYQGNLHRKRSECEFFRTCTRQHVCGNLSCSEQCSGCRSKRCAVFCPDFTPQICDKPKKPPITIFMVNTPYIQ